jgi:hypothetical protein
LQNRQKKDSDETKSGSVYEEIAKYTIKDSVFTNLFQDKKYLIQLYHTLHPEDTEATEDSLKDITIHNILTDDIYNDLGFLVGNRLVILVEAQSTWTVNIILRILMYLMRSYQEYLKRTKQNIYKSKKVTFPKPEFYVIYTGERKARPEYISLSEEFFDGEEGFLDVKVKVLYGEGKEDIISQYVTFTKVYDEQVKLYERTRQAIMETIRICKDEDVLKEYLESREKEVVEIMLAMYDEKEILISYIESEKYEATQEAAKEAAMQLLRLGKLSVEEIAGCVPSLSVEEIRALQEKLVESV